MFRAHGSVLSVHIASGRGGRVKTAQMKSPQFSHCEEAMRRLSLLQFSIFQCLEEVGSESPGRVLTGSAGHGTSNLAQCLAGGVV